MKDIHHHRKLPQPSPTITNIISILLLLSVLLPQSAAVNIHLIRGQLTATCTDIAPGICCSIDTIPGAGIVHFQHLLARDVAAVWVPRSTTSSPTWITGCSGLLLESRNGPGEWYWHERLWTTAYGASYITLPESVPPDGATAKWLTVESLLGLAWGGGKWFASEAAKAYLERVAGGGAQGLSGGLVRRGIRSANKGQAYIGRPRRAVLPDVIEIGGQRFTGGGTTPVYQNGAGTLVNLTDIWEEGE
ncbi:MAG: hypothetical protein LQ337_005377 [Flavoplaca oasis]|nr:MAG: hypothetical protein LQ337_005377 [Flavoplaca oasis]